MTTDCHICGFEGLKVTPQSKSFRRVTSDCKPWHLGGELGLCPRCHTVQAIISPEWLADAEKIYKNYEVYHQAGGTEQAVFTTAGESDTRSSRLVSGILQTSSLSSRGQVLDVGCGNGNFLKTFGASFPEWKLFGAEFDDKHLSDLRTINGFQALYTGVLDDISERFDFISIIHTLEHIVGPKVFLERVAELLVPGGILFIQVPHYTANPFELMTADHASHFDTVSLSRLLEDAGMVPWLVSTDWVGKEISAIAGGLRSHNRNGQEVSVELTLAGSLGWLRDFLAKAKLAQARSSFFGLFGSSIAATWTAINLPRLPDFFVDEDPARVGRTHLGRPILHPLQAPTDSDVFVALQANPAAAVMKRHAGISPARWSS